MKSSDMNAAVASRSLLTQALLHALTTSSGVMCSGIVKLPGQHYFLGAELLRHTSLLVVNSSWMFAHSSGSERRQPGMSSEQAVMSEASLTSHLPLKTGARFSIMAMTASRQSSV